MFRLHAYRTEDPPYNKANNAHSQGYVHPVILVYYTNLVSAHRKVMQYIGQSPRIQYS